MIIQYIVSTKQDIRVLYYQAYYWNIYISIISDI